jgi:hypothetical protein
MLTISEQAKTLLTIEQEVLSIGAEISELDFLIRQLSIKKNQLIDKRNGLSIVFTLIQTQSPVQLRYFKT